MERFASLFHIGKNITHRPLLTTGPLNYDIERNNHVSQFKVFSSKQVASTYDKNEWKSRLHLEVSSVLWNEWPAKEMYGLTRPLTSLFFITMHKPQRFIFWHMDLASPGKDFFEFDSIQGVVLFNKTQIKMWTSMNTYISAWLDTV